MKLNFKFPLIGAMTAFGVAAFPALSMAQDVTGAGATFPAPLYSKWAADYNKATGVKINYQSVGSGAGLRQIEAKTVDFGASDAPLKDDELAKKGLVQFPTVIGGVVPVVNIKGINPGQLKLSGQILGDIYLGKITKWTDPAIKPEVLLLGEPCSALDPISTAKVEDLITELKNDYTVVIVTHNMQQAARCSDYTAYMYLGDLVEFGVTEELFFKPKRKETEDYITGRFG